MSIVIHRICWLDETVEENPDISQFNLGDVDKITVLPNGFYVGYGGVNPHWPGGGLRPRYLMWRHAANLYAVLSGTGSNDCRIDWLEDSPRNGLRGYPYCEQGTHGWRVFACTGWDNTAPEDPIWLENQIMTVTVQPPAPSTVTAQNPWIYGNYEFHEIIPSIPITIAGFDMCACLCCTEDPICGEELN